MSLRNTNPNIPYAVAVYSLTIISFLLLNITLFLNYYSSLVTTRTEESFSFIILIASNKFVFLAIYIGLYYILILLTFLSRFKCTYNRVFVLIKPITFFFSLIIGILLKFFYFILSINY